jgi:Helix-turn-helix of DDE superfamily endonuclease
MVLHTRHVSLTDERSLKSYTGVSSKAFGVLCGAFSKVEEEERQARYEHRLASGKKARRPGGGKTGSLPEAKDRLLFILHYLKEYPTMDNLGSDFQLCRSSACERVHSLARTLQSTLSSLGVLPHRQFTSSEEFRECLQALGDISALIIDATEREHLRPRDKEKRDALYSGKKSATPSRIPSSQR